MKSPTIYLRRLLHAILRIPSETVGLFSKIFQRLEGMERNLMNRMTTLERKVDMKNLQQLKVQNTNPAASPPPK